VSPLKIFVIFYSYSLFYNRKPLPSSADATKAAKNAPTSAPISSYALLLLKHHKTHANSLSALGAYSPCSITHYEKTKKRDSPVIYAGLISFLRLSLQYLPWAHHRRPPPPQRRHDADCSSDGNWASAINIAPPPPSKKISLIPLKKRPFCQTLFPLQASNNLAWTWQHILASAHDASPHSADQDQPLSFGGVASSNVGNGVFLDVVRRFLPHRGVSLYSIQPVTP